MIDFRKISNPQIDYILYFDEEIDSDSSTSVQRQIYSSPSNTTINAVDFKDIDKNQLGYYLKNYTYLTYEIEDYNKGLSKFNVLYKQVSPEYIKKILSDSNFTDIEVKLLAFLNFILQYLNYKPFSLHYNIEYIDNFLFTLSLEKQSTESHFFGIYESRQQNPFYNLRKIDRLYNNSFYYTVGKREYKQFNRFKFSQLTSSFENRIFIFEKSNLSLQEESSVLNIINSNFSLTAPPRVYKNIGFSLFINGKEYILLFLPIPGYIVKYNEFKEILDVARQYFPSNIFDYKELSAVYVGDLNDINNVFNIFSIYKSLDIFHFYKNSVKNKIYEFEFNRNDNILSRNQLQTINGNSIDSNLKQKIIYVENPVSNEEEYYPIGYDSTAILTFGNNQYSYSLIGFDTTTSEPVQYIVSKKYSVSNINYRDYRIQIGGVVPLNNDELLQKKSYNYRITQQLTAINPPFQTAVNILELHKYVYNLTYDYSQQIQKSLLNYQNLIDQYGNTIQINFQGLGYILNFKGVDNVLIAYSQKYFSDPSEPVSNSLNYELLLPEKIIVELFTNRTTDVASIEFFNKIFKKISSSNELKTYKTIFGDYKVCSINSIKDFYIDLNLQNIEYSFALSSILETLFYNIFIKQYMNIFLEDLINLFNYISTSDTSTSFKFDYIKNVINYDTSIIGNLPLKNRDYYQVFEESLRTNRNSYITVNYETRIVNTENQVEFDIYIDNYLVSHIDSTTDSTSKFNEWLLQNSLDGTTIYSTFIPFPSQGVILLKDVIYIRPLLLQQLYINRSLDSPFSNLSNALISGVIIPGKILVYLIQDSKKKFRNKLYNFFDILTADIADSRMKEMNIYSLHSRFLVSDVLDKSGSVNIFNKTEPEFESQLNSLLFQNYRYIFRVLPSFQGKIIYSPFGFYSKDYIFTVGMNYKILLKSI